MLGLAPKFFFPKFEVYPTLGIACDPNKNSELVFGLPGKGCRAVNAVLDPKVLGMYLWRAAAATRAQPTCCKARFQLDWFL